MREGRTVGVLLPARGSVTLQLKLIAKLGGDVTRRQLAFGIPPALSSRVSVVIDEAEADVEFPTAVSFERTSANQQTRVEAVIGPAERLELNWTPRVKRAAEIVATVFVQNTALVTIGGGVMNTRATLDYQISQGELKQVRVQIPAGQRLLRVEGDAIRSWEIKDDTLVVDLLKGVSPAWKLTVETEKVLEKLPATVKVELPHALDVKRETGLVALRASEEVSLTVENAQELQRVDAEEFHRAAPDKKDGILSAFRFLKTDFSLSVRARNRAAADRGRGAQQRAASAPSRCRSPRRWTTPSSAPGCSRCGWRCRRATGSRASRATRCPNGWNATRTARRWSR